MVDSCYTSAGASHPSLHAPCRHSTPHLGMLLAKASVRCSSMHFRTQTSLLYGYSTLPEYGSFNIDHCFCSYSLRRLPADSILCVTVRYNCILNDRSSLRIVFTQYQGLTLGARVREMRKAKYAQSFENVDSVCSIFPESAGVWSKQKTTQNTDQGRSRPALANCRLQICGSLQLSDYGVHAHRLDRSPSAVQIYTP